MKEVLFTIRYIGKKHLNSNFYKRIVLQQEDEIIKVRTVVDSQFKDKETIKIDTKVITKQLDGLDDYESVKEIVSYFLRNNTICEISQEVDKIVVNSTSNRTLSLVLDKTYAPILKIIIDKYNNDRLQFIDKNTKEDVYVRTTHLDEKFNITSGTSSYFKGYNKYDSSEEVIVLTLASKKGEIVKFDKIFLMEYIKEILNNSSKTIINFNRNDRTGLCIFLDNRMIKVPDDDNIVDEVRILINNRNSEIIEMNNKQLKLEGRKWKN